ERGGAGPTAARRRGGRNGTGEESGRRCREGRGDFFGRKRGIGRMSVPLGGLRWMITLGGRTVTKPIPGGYTSTASCNSFHGQQGAETATRYENIRENRYLLQSICTVVVPGPHLRHGGRRTANPARKER